MFIGIWLAVVAVAAVGIWLGVSGLKKTGQGDTIGSQPTVTTMARVDEETTTSTTEIPDPTPPAAQFGETLEFWGTSMSVSSPELLVDGEIQALVGDQVDVYVVSATIENSTTETRDYNLFYWEALDEDGTSYDASLYLEDQALDTGDLAPGQAVTGKVGFELPKGKTVASVLYSPLLADQTAAWTK